MNEKIIYSNCPFQDGSHLYFIEPRCRRTMKTQLVGGRLNLSWLSPLGGMSDRLSFVSHSTVTQINSKAYAFMRAAHSLEFVLMVRNMVTNAKRWAESQGLTRVNPVHGATEYRVATEWLFKNKNLERTATKASGSADMEAGPSWLILIDLEIHDATPQVCHGFGAPGRMGEASFWATVLNSQVRDWQ